MSPKFPYSEYATSSKIIQTQTGRRLQNVEDEVKAIADDLRKDAAGLVWETVDFNSSLTPPSNSEEWSSICYGGGLFVACSWFNNYDFMTSPDGKNWTVSSNPEPGVWWEQICYGDGLFVACGGGGIITSPDAKNWTLRVSGGMNVYAIVYGNGRFVAPSTNGQCYVSTDGKTWTTHNMLGNNDTWYDVCYGKGVFVAVGGGGASDEIATSVDGETWTARTSPVSESLIGCTYGNGKFVAIGLGSDAIYSYDSVNWTASPIGNTETTWSSIKFGGGLYVAVGEGSSVEERVAVSKDAVTWTRINAAGDDDRWFGLAYGNNIFVAVSYVNDRVMVSGTLGESISGAENANHQINKPSKLAEVGFNGSDPVATVPTITGSTGGIVPLQQLLTALESYGLLTDSTT